MKRKESSDKAKRTRTLAIKVPTARTVQLAADFTQWQERPIDLHKENDGVWSTTVELEPGEHQYRFLVDGQWSDDPAAKQTVPNPFGGLNAVLRV
jgi:1,4-alpha-glucan branching enzyme